MYAIDEDDDVVVIELSFRKNVLFNSGGELSSDVVVNNEFNNADACNTDVDMVDATMFVADAEGEPINGT